MTKIKINKNSPFSILHSPFTHGYIALSTVLIISVVVIALSTTVSLLSIGEAQSSFAQLKGEDTLDFVEGCAEDALLKARVNAAYTGGTITRPEGTCSVSISKAGSQWTIDVTTTATAYIRTIRVVCNRTGTGLTLISWKEI